MGVMTASLIFCLASIKYYVRNDHLGLSIPYEHQGITHSYEPDFIVRLKNGINVLLETKGYKR